MSKCVRRFVLVGACLAVVAWAGCKKSGEPEAAIVPVLGEVTVTNDSKNRGEGRLLLDEALLMREARSQLERAAVFAAPGAHRLPRADVELRFVAELRDAPDIQGLLARGFVHLTVAVSGPEAGRARAFVENTEAAAEAPLPRAHRDDPRTRARVQAFVARMIVDVLSDYAGRLRLGDADEAKLIAALSSKTVDEIEEAARLIGERRIKGGADRLLALLSHQDERVRDAALGALLRLGDRRAVTELGRTRSMRDRREMSKILDAIAILGGQEAISYLEFVRDAHEDDEVKAMAAAALARLTRHEGVQENP